MQKTKLKTVVWWVVATFAAVPLTKLAESHLDVSFFSPAIVGLWNWIQSVWGWLGSDVSFPVWAVILTTLLIVFLLIPVGVLVYARYEKAWETKGAPLTEDQHRAFVAIGMAAQRGEKIGFDQIRQDGRLSRIATQNALDHLYNVGLIDALRDSFGFTYPELTPLGRDYYLELERERGVGQFG